MILIIAFISMLIDHIWFIFFPTDEIWRIFWRFAYPLFAWWIVRWYKFTKNKFKYAKRLFIMAIISQIPILLVFWDGFYNVLFTLLFGLISIYTIDENKIKLPFKIILISFLLYISQIFNFDYPIYWILTIILLHIFWEQKKSILAFSLLTILFYNIDYTNFSFVYSYQLYAILALVLIYFTPIQKYDFKLNFYFKYWFYPFLLKLTSFTSFCFSFTFLEKKNILLIINLNIW